MTGLRFGRLVAIAFSHANRGGRAQWLFACDCGSETIADGGNVRGGSTASCGCLHREISAARLTTHGHRAGKRHGPTYRAWQLMNNSCADPLSSGWKHCGARGIAVAPCWRSDFPAFLRDMGERPADAVLTRTDPAVGFSPGNCHWAEGRSRAERAADGARARRSSRSESNGKVARLPSMPVPSRVAGQSGPRSEAFIQSSAAP